jgi:ribosomal protein S18 acetylase RimI-like enzyme
MARSSGVTIREYREADKAAVIDLVRDLQAHELAIYEMMKAPADMGAWYIDHIKDEVAKYQGRFLVAEGPKGLAGYATLLIDVPSDDPVEIEHTYARVADLSVAKAHRGKGIGTALLHECEAHAKARGQTILLIGVLAGNHRARKLYHAVGFRDVGITMTKQLG